MLMEAVRLRRGELRVDLAPWCGGSIIQFFEETASRPYHWLRPASLAAITDRNPLGMACFPLIPFSNRVRNARFVLRGRTIDLPRNFPPEPHALHGDGWQSEWRVTHKDASSAELVLDRSNGEYPIPYRATQRVVLNPDGLCVDLSLVNAGDEPHPLGIGLHPYFPMTADCRATANLPELWLVDGEFMPTERVKTPTKWNFSGGRLLNGSDLANTFCQWDGTAVLEWPAEQRRMTIVASDSMRYVVMFTPSGQDFFCVEPASNAVDAFNLGAGGVPDVGYMLLGPQDGINGTVNFLLG
jgi:aldose 1-epimerase